MEKTAKGDKGRLRDRVVRIGWNRDSFGKLSLEWTLYGLGQIKRVGMDQVR